MDRLLTFFGVERDKDGELGDVFPLGMAPFFRLSVEGQEGGTPALVAARQSPSRVTWRCSTLVWPMSSAGLR